ncbi:MAG: putative manganese transporter, partial [Candidatus Aminicenantes bacterium]|nr:putative manganese transporter [Candidatus Aminicenantes bacterium]
MLDIAGLLKESLTIVALVFVMMVAVDYVNVATKGKLKGLLKGGQWRQYVTSSFLGVTPGCAGSFMTVSLYVHGLISFGAIVGAMIATSGDEAFVMLSLFPKKALMLF